MLDMPTYNSLRISAISNQFAEFLHVPVKYRLEAAHFDLDDLFRLVRQF
jgi:hypothetical protein